MATNISTYLSDKLLDAAFRKAAYTSTDVYLGLFTTAPTMPAGTGGTEVSGGSYARVHMNTALSAASAEQITNSSDLDFAQATGDWGTAVSLGIWDAITAGNLLASSPLSPSKTVSSGDTLSFDAGDLIITLT